ncbi:MAG: TlpA family protein disulfide reductase [Deltaproteobacteria bacterium]|nr:TlpA family protein disulfide reductase [Deltaproteobacteria bacterium]
MIVRANATLACLLFVAALACSRGEEATSAAAGPCAAVSERKPAPALALESLDGRAYSLADLEGKTVIIDFWATWCPPCEFQIPVLNAVYDAWRDRGVVVLGVAVDAEGAEIVAPYAAEHAIRYPVLLGNEALARSFGAVGFPTSVLVAPDGSMTRAHAGLVEKEDLDARLACLQPEKPAQGEVPAATPSS